MNWIKVEDELPEQAERVLCLTNHGTISVGYYYDLEWRFNDRSCSFIDFSYKITHWMPLPKPPTE